MLYVYQMSICTNYNLGATFAKKTAAMDLATESHELTLLTSGKSFGQALALYSGRLCHVDVHVRVLQAPHTTTPHYLHYLQL